MQFGKTAIKASLCVWWWLVCACVRVLGVISLLIFMHMH